MLYTFCCESFGLVNEFTIKQFDNYVAEMELFNTTLNFVDADSGGRVGPILHWSRAPYK